jgi:hypothetical protein
MLTYAGEFLDGQRHGQGEGSRIDAYALTDADGC